MVREALLSAGMVAPEIERLAASVRASDGLPRFVWTEERPDPASYVRVILAAISERQRWRAQYQTAVDTVSATGPPNEAGCAARLKVVDRQGRSEESGSRT